MAKITFPDEILKEIAALDSIVSEANEQKRKVLFKALGIKSSAKDLEAMKEWKLTAITVPDNQIAVQLNKMVAYVPNIMFVFDATAPIFSLREGEKKRRVRKER